MNAEAPAEEIPPARCRDKVCYQLLDLSRGGGRSRSGGVVPLSSKKISA